MPSRFDKGNIKNAEINRDNLFIFLSGIIPKIQCQ